MTNFYPPFKVITTSPFRKEAEKLKKKYPKIKDDFLELADKLKKNPISGNDSLGRNCYKVRMQISDKGNGESGGARVIINVIIEDNQVFILSAYDKSEKDTISEKELDQLIKRKLEL